MSILYQTDGIQHDPEQQGLLLDWAQRGDLLIVTLDYDAVVQAGKDAPSAMRSVWIADGALYDVMRIQGNQERNTMRVEAVRRE